MPVVLCELSNPVCIWLPSQGDEFLNAEVTGDGLLGKYHTYKRRQLLRRKSLQFHVIYYGPTAESRLYAANGPEEGGFTNPVTAQYPYKFSGTEINIYTRSNDLVLLLPGVTNAEITGFKDAMQALLFDD